jgi:intraflagellar transport protein 56
MKRASSASKPPGGDSRPRLPALDDFLAQDDFTGACTLLEFQLRAGAGEGASSSAGSSAAAPQLLWLAWAAFHKGDYRRALEHYRALLEDVKPSELEGLPGASPPAALHALRACCLFYLGDVAGAEAAANAAPDGPLRNRVLFHAHAKLGNEAAMMACHAKLGVGRKEDQLCLAATHFARGHVQEALDAYKRVLAEHPEDVAIHVYIALCCFKLDYYDLSLDSLAVYLQAHPASPFAVNLKACIQYKLVNGKQAAGELRALTEQGYAVEGDDTLRHNLVVFRGGEGALGVLPGLMAALPEARLNLAMHHLKCGQLADAAALLEDVVPSSVPEYQLKASLAALWGQAQLLGRAGAAGGGAALKGVTAHEALKQARALFHAVGSSPVECDTIPGRQCMALSYFLMRKVGVPLPSPPSPSPPPPARPRC